MLAGKHQRLDQIPTPHPTHQRAGNLTESKYPAVRWQHPKNTKATFKRDLRDIAGSFNDRSAPRCVPIRSFCSLDEHYVPPRINTRLRVTFSRFWGTALAGIARRTVVHDIQAVTGETRM